MRAIITVDDIGLHPAVLRAANKLHAKKRISALSVVGNGDIEKDLAEFGLDIGVHLDIVRGQPVCRGKSIKTIVQKNGMFLGDVEHLFSLYAAGKIDHEHIESEWRTQIERVIEHGLNPVYLSSHKQVHAWPSLFQMALKLAEEYGIQWIRKPDSCDAIARLNEPKMREKFKNVCSFYIHESDSVQWADCVYLQGGKNDFTEEEIVRFIESEKGIESESLIEIVCQPGIAIAGDPPLQRELQPTVLSQVWAHCFESVSAESWCEMLQNKHLKMVRYDCLTK